MKKTNFFDKTITRQLSFSIGAILLILFIGLGIFLTTKINKAYTQVSTDYLNEISAYYTENTKTILEKEFAIGETLKDTFEQYTTINPGDRRSFYDNLLKETLKTNPDLVDAWTCWEPDALDGLDSKYAYSELSDHTGRFIPYWTQVDSVIECTPLTEYEDGSWYVDPMSRNKGKLIDPNPYEVGGQMMWVCGVAFPIEHRGKNVGVVGIDMSLQKLSEMLKSAKIYESGYLTLVSNEGLNAVDLDESTEGQTNLFWSSSQYSSLFEEAKNTLKYKSFFTKDKILHIIQPITVSNADQTWYLILNAPLNEIQKDQKVIIGVILLGFIVTTLLVLAFTYLSISIISRALNKGVKALENIAHGDGDLTARIEAGKDNELGKMYNFFNATMEKLQNSIGKVKEESEQMAVVGEILTNNMSDTAAAANEITANIDSVNREVKNQAANVKSADESVKQINQNVKNLIEYIESQSSCVVESSSAIEEMVANIRSVTNILEQNGQTIDMLEQSSELGKTRIATSVQATEKIKEQSETLLEASKIIQNIASQTNLLAMNAAIEAAHAGDSGKGFSVVADEIRKLAEDSNTQGKAITSNLTEVLSSIQEVANAAAQMQEQFNEIYELTRKVAQQELTIKHAMQEQSEGGGQVLTAMKEINDITVNVKTGGSEMKYATESVNKEMESLIRITDEITASMEEMALGIQSINQSINEANDQTHKTGTSIENLTSVVDTFKV